MKKIRNNHNLVVGIFQIDGVEFECVQKGGHPSKEGWVGDPAYLAVRSGEYHLGYVKGDYNLEGDEVMRRMANVRLNGKNSEYFVQ